MQISLCMDNHRGEEEYRSPERPTRIVGRHDAPLVKSTLKFSSVQHTLLRDVSSRAKPCPSQTGVTISATVQISGSKTDVWRSQGKDNHKGEEEYGGSCKIHPINGQHDVLPVKKR